VLILDQALTRGHAQAMRIFAEHNVTIVLFPTHLTHVQQPVLLARVRRFKAFQPAKFHQLTRHQRLLVNAFAELGRTWRRQAGNIGASGREGE
jgi:hypothetical protein